MTINRTKSPKNQKKSDQKPSSEQPNCKHAPHFVHAPKFIMQIVQRKCRVSFWQYVLSVVVGSQMTALLDDALFGFLPHSRFYHEVVDNNPTWAGDAGVLFYLILLCVLSYGLFRLIGAIRD